MTELSTIEDRQDVIRSFAELPKGWLDNPDGGDVIHPEAITFAVAILDDLEGHAHTHIYCYPTVDGGISLEWDWKIYRTSDKAMASLEITDINVRLHVLGTGVVPVQFVATWNDMTVALTQIPSVVERVRATFIPCCS